MVLTPTYARPDRSRLRIKNHLSNSEDKTTLGLLMDKKIKGTLKVSQEIREKIRLTGLTLEEYFNRIYNQRQSFDMDRWTEGTFWIQHFRICLFSAETLNHILNQLPEETLHKIGREAGQALRSTIEKAFPQKLEELSKTRFVEHLNTYAGWGKFTLNNNTIITTTPIFSKPHLLARG